MTVDRSQIDQLDETLIALFKDRRAVSVRVQQQRIAADRSRWTIARGLLHLCRGR